MIFLFFRGDNMKIMHLIMVTLMLAILTIGAVSASDDIITDDALTFEGEDSVGDAIDNEISAADSEDPVELPSEANELGVRFDDIKSDIVVYSEFNTNDDSSTDEKLAYVSADDYVDGTVTVLIDNVQYYKKTFSKYAGKVTIYNFELKLPNNLKTGNHNVVVTYQRNGFIAKSVTKTVDFDYKPILTYLDDIALGETNYLRYKSGVVGRTGSIAVFNMNGNSKGSYITTVAVKDAQATIAIKGSAIGDYKYWLDFNVDGRSFSRTVEFTVHANTAGFKATVPSKIYVGASAAVTFTGPYKGDVMIFVDGKAVKKVKYNGGKITDLVSGMTLGKHQISVQYDRGMYFYSKTFNVNVVKKPPVVTLKLNKVKVKKSAKKLVLKATLKLDKKAKKGLKVTFKFNGKKFKAKTNRKGVVKVTVKKKFLKKLKVGKKVKYQVTYGKKTAKRTAKVLN